MRSKEILELAMKLRAEEKFILVEGLLKSLDEPDKRLDDIWAKEAEKRLGAYRAGRIVGVPMEKIFSP